MVIQGKKTVHDAHIVGMFKKPHEPTKFSWFYYNSEDNDRELLMKCFTWYLKKSCLWIDSGNDIKDACDNNLKVVYLGVDLVLF